MLRRVSGFDDQRRKFWAGWGETVLLSGMRDNVVVVGRAVLCVSRKRRSRVTVRIREWTGVMVRDRPRPLGEGNGMKGRRCQGGEEMKGSLRRLREFESWRAPRGNGQPVRTKGG
jgi:hypothetical protein